MGHMSAVVAHPARLDEVSARWRQFLDDKSLSGLPFKIETNRAGQIIMSPAKSIDGRFQLLLARLLEATLEGKTITECSIATPDGVKVADVAWAPNTSFDQYEFQDPYAVAPPICVEIKSPSNARAELLTKVHLYLDAGAKEAWLVDANGQVTSHDHSGPIERSSFAIDVAPLT